MPRPTSRKKDSAPSGKFSETRESWVQVNAVELVNHVGEAPDIPYVIEAPGADLHRLGIRFRGSPRSNYINLSSLTLPELDALQEFINRAIDMARPSVIALDEYATRRFEEGDDTYARVYRAKPKIVVRQRKGEQHDQGLPSGPERSTIEPYPDAGLPELGGAGEPVSDQEQGRLGTSDDEPEARSV